MIAINNERELEIPRAPHFVGGLALTSAGSNSSLQQEESMEDFCKIRLLLSKQSSAS